MVFYAEKRFLYCLKRFMHLYRKLIYNHGNRFMKNKLFIMVIVCENLVVYNGCRLCQISFLVHLSQKLNMSYCGHLPSVVVRRASTPLNDLIFETPEQILFKLYVEPSVKGGLKFVQIVTVYLLRRPPCPYMVKHLKFFFSRTKKALRLNLGI